MMRLYLLLVCLLIPYLQLSADNNKGMVQTNNNLDFDTFLSGVQYAYIELGEEDQRQVDQEGSILLEQFAAYLQDLGFRVVAMTTKEKEELNKIAASVCDIAYVKPEIMMIKSMFTNHVVFFRTCLNDEFKFFSSDTLYNDTELLGNLYNLWSGLYERSGAVFYNENNRLQLPYNGTQWDETLLRGHYAAQAIDYLEGIYEKVLEGPSDANKYQISIVRNNDGNYDILYLNGAVNYLDWKEGEIIGKMMPTGTTDFFKTFWYMPNKKLAQDVYIKRDAKNMLTVTFANNASLTYKYFKIFPQNLPSQHSYATPPRVKSTHTGPLKATGSSIAITSDGYIVTNYHVIEGGNFFEVEGKIRGIPGMYNAVLMIHDQVNDLAVLKIEDPSFVGFPSIPYEFRKQVSEVGEEVFTLGYPLTTTMGTQIKATDGIISAQRGYNGDVSTYQVSAPVQPGSSGGPLFDKNGHLIGVIKAKHAQAENASYAIKTRNVLNLLDLLPTSLNIPENNTLAGLPLKEQIKQLENFVFLVRVYE